MRFVIMLLAFALAGCETLPQADAPQPTTKKSPAFVVQDINGYPRTTQALRQSLKTAGFTVHDSASPDVKLMLVTTVGLQERVKQPAFCRIKSNFSSVPKDLAVPKPTRAQPQEIAAPREVETSGEASNDAVLRGKLTSEEQDATVAQCVDRHVASIVRNMDFLLAVEK